MALKGISRSDIEKYLNLDPEFVKEWVSKNIQRNVLEQWLQEKFVSEITVETKTVEPATTTMTRAAPEAKNANFFDQFVRGSTKRSAPPRERKEELLKVNQKDMFMELIRDIANELDVNVLCHKILINVGILTRCDRGSLFLTRGTRDNKYLVSKLFDVTESSSIEETLHTEENHITVPFGRGIAGTVALSKLPISIKDAYQDARFNKDVDKKTGYRTRNILCMPILDYEGEVIGVAQILNKMDGGTEFTFEDEEVKKFAITVELLLGDIPDKAIFRHPMIRKTLQPYFQLTQAVRTEQLAKFSQVLDKYGKKFEAEGTYTLIVRLRHNVIKTGLGLEKFHGVGIMGHNAPEWIVSCLAAIYAGGVVVGIHYNHPVEACQRVAMSAQCNIIVVDSAEELDKILQIRLNLPDLMVVVHYGAEGAQKMPGVMSAQCNIIVADSAEELDKILQIRLNLPDLMVVVNVSFLPLNQPTGALLDIIIPLIYATTVYFVPRKRFKMRAKGRHVFKGTNEPQMTADAFDEDGWFKTTDMGYKDESGFIWITGGTHDLFQLSDGRIVCPTPIEKAVRNHLPFMGHCIACGQHRPFVIMLFTLQALTDTETDIPLDVLSKRAEMWLRKIDVEISAILQMVANPLEKLVSSIQSVIDQVNTSVLDFTTAIRKWKLLPRDFSIPTGELSPHSVSLPDRCRLGSSGVEIDGCRTKFVSIDKTIFTEDSEDVNSSSNNNTEPMEWEDEDDVASAGRRAFPWQPRTQPTTSQTTFPFPLLMMARNSPSSRQSVPQANRSTRQGLSTSSNRTQRPSVTNTRSRSTSASVRIPDEWTCYVCDIENSRDTCRICNEARYACGIKPPSYWTSAPDESKPTTLVPIETDENEFQSFGAVLDGCFTSQVNGIQIQATAEESPQRRIVRMWRNENLRSFQKYSVRREQVKRELKLSDMPEKMYWHGTAMENIKNISTSGFKMSKVGKHGAALGKGLYFSASPEYSLDPQFATPDRFGHQVLLLCRVCVGSYGLGSTDLEDPPFMKGQRGKNGQRHHSVVDNVKRPVVYCVFDECQCFVEYVVKVKTLN